MIGLILFSLTIAYGKNTSDMYRMGPCLDEKFSFPCKSGLCISSSLVCDGYNHCGDNEDEPKFHETCRYLPKLCNEVGKISYKLERHSTMLILQGGIPSTVYTHERCYTEISSNIKNSSHIIASVRRIDSDYWESDCSTMLQIYAGNSRNVTFCNANKSAVDTLNIESNTSIKIFSFVALDNKSEYEIMILAAGKGPCGGNFNFSCQNGLCISTDLVCDGYSHCDDGSDESLFYANCIRLQQEVFSSITGISLSIGFTTLVLILIFLGIAYHIWKRNAAKRTKNNFTDVSQKNNKELKFTETLASNSPVNPLPDVEEVTYY